MYKLSQYLILLKQKKSHTTNNKKKTAHSHTIYFISFNFALAYNSQLKKKLFENKYMQEWGTANKSMM